MSRYFLLACTLALQCAAASQEDYIVKDLPGLSNIPAAARPVMHAGHLELNADNNTELFFWRFQDPRANKTHNMLHRDELIVWLNGGPGCSSMDGAMMETGPLRVTDNLEVELNPGSWTQVADLVFVDQPAGTGFSYTDSYDTELKQAAQHFWQFLKTYYELFPQDRTKKLYLAGESYAGQYIPYFAKEIDENNSLNITLEGLLIGNGWIDPDIQSLSYVPFSLEAGFLDRQSPSMSQILKQHEKCQQAIDDPSNHDFEKLECVKIFNSILTATKDASKPANEQCVNMYDYRKHDYFPACGSNWPEDLPNVTKFLNLDAVQKALNLKSPKRWHECDGKVEFFFRPEHSAKSFDLLPKLLEKIKITLFAGDKDIICNHKSIEMLIEKLQISPGQFGFTQSRKSGWIYDGQEVGEIETQSNLTYVKVFNSSHMVPYDLPEVSRGLFDIITNSVEKRSTDVVTPVYDSKGNYKFVEEKQETDQDNEEEKEKSAKHHHSLTFYVAEVVILAVLACLLYSFYKSFAKSRKSAFLSLSSKKKKKQVHWFDESDIGMDQEAGEADHKPKSMLESVFNKLGYGGQYDTVRDAPDIEMAPVEEHEDQFIIQSDEEEFGHR
ncbi:hypothetical protein KL909_004629 [Ogataea angusta]|nr:hypothetical protein KL909_004629 [Ogataea angusta]